MSLFKTYFSLLGDFMYKKMFLKFCSYTFIFVFLKVFFASSYYVDAFYNPKELMKGENTTIEGGRYAYDSLNVQQHLLKNTYPSDGEKIVFLTFDDGPSLDNTPKVLETLKKYDVRATFFVLGSNLDRGPAYEELLKRTLEEGHAIANHGYTHKYSYLYPGRFINYDNLISDMNRSHESMKRILGDDFNTRVLRLPGGIRSWKGQNETLERLNNEGYSIIEWNSLSGDADGRPVNNPDDLSSYAIRTAGKASCVVVLMHDFAGKSGAISAQALPTIIEHFKNNGYTFRTMY